MSITPQSEIRQRRIAELRKELTQLTGESVIVPVGEDAGWPALPESSLPQPAPAMPDFKSVLYQRIFEIAARQIMLLFAGAFVSIGYLTTGDVDPFVEKAVPYSVGVLTALAAFIWSYWRNKRHLAELSTTRHLAPVTADGAPLTYKDITAATKSGVFKPVQ